MSDVIIFAKALSKSFKQYPYNGKLNLLARCIDKAVEVSEPEIVFNRRIEEQRKHVERELSKGREVTLPRDVYDQLLANGRRLSHANKTHERSKAIWRKTPKNGEADGETGNEI